MHILVDSPPKMKNKHEVDCIFAINSTSEYEHSCDYTLDGNDYTTDIERIKASTPALCVLKQMHICDLCNEHTCPYLRVAE